MKYPKPQTVHVRARSMDVAKPIDKETPTPRLAPDIDVILRSEISAAVPVYDYGDGTQLWMVQFHWPTHDWQQDAIAATVAKLPKGTAWTAREALPTTTISVQELVPDVSKPAVDGVQPVKVMVVARTLKSQAAKYAFAGEALAVAVEAKPVVEAVEKA